MTWWIHRLPCVKTTTCLNKKNVWILISPFWFSLSNPLKHSLRGNNICLFNVCIQCFIKTVPNVENKLSWKFSYHLFAPDQQILYTELFTRPYVQVFFPWIRRGHCRTSLSTMRCNPSAPGFLAVSRNGPNRERAHKEPKRTIRNVFLHLSPELGSVLTSYSRFTNN